MIVLDAMYTEIETLTNHLTVAEEEAEERRWRAT
jgi:hypothetical protein